MFIRKALPVSNTALGPNLMKQTYVEFNLTIQLTVFCSTPSILSFTSRHHTFRNVNIPALNDSKYIGLSIYNVVIFSALGVPLSYLLADNSGYTYAIVGGLIIFCTTLTLCLLFLPKVRLHILDGFAACTPQKIV